MSQKQIANLMMNNGKINRGNPNKKHWALQVLAALLILLLPIVLALSPLLAQENTGITNNRPFALINGTIIDGTGRMPVTYGIILVEGDKIIASGRKADINIPADAQIIDVNGAIILPGLINAHVHNAYFEKHAAIWASCGVTTVRDLSCGRNEVEKAIAFRNKTNSNPKLCRVVSAGSMIVVPWGYMGRYGIKVTSEKDARNKVKQELDAGVDFVKITLQEPRFPELANLSPRLASLIVSLAHERGVPVTAHVGTADDLKAALDCKVDDIAHIVDDELTAELIQRMIKNNTYMEPTLTNWATSTGKERATILDNFKRFIDAGGQIALGAEHIPTAKHDGPFVGMPIAEFLMMREAGMTPMQIITASTLNSAKVCKLDKILGTLEAGKIADILVLNGNPLEDLNYFSKVKMVIHNGAIIREE